MKRYYCSGCRESFALGADKPPEFCPFCTQANPEELPPPQPLVCGDCGHEIRPGQAFYRDNGTPVHDDGLCEYGDDGATNASR